MSEAARLEGVIALVGVDAAAKGLKTVGDASDKTQTSLDGLGKKSQDTSKKVHGLSASIQAAGQKAGDVGQTMNRKVTLPLVGVGIAATKVGSDFDKTIRQLGANAQLGGKELDVMRNQALKLGKDTSFSAREAAQAMLELSKGGITPAQMQAGVLGETLTLASAGGLELGAAAAYMSNTMNAFGISAGEASTVAAALAGGANASTASVESLGMGLSQVSAQAKQSGMSMNETVAALAAFDQAGVKGSDAGTSLKTMLQRLNPQTEEAAAQMKKLGIDFTDAQGNFKPMADVAEELKTGLNGLGSESERTAALTAMFGSDASRAAAILGTVGKSGIDKYATATRDLGAAQRMAKTNTEGTTGSIEKMMGSVETAGIKIGTSLAPHVVSAAGFVGSLADSFSELDRSTQTWIIGSAAALAAVGPLSSGISGMIGGVGGAVNGITMLGTGIGSLAMRAGTAIPALASLSLMVASNPLLTGAVAIAGIVGAGVAIATMADESQDLAESARRASDAVGDLGAALLNMGSTNIGVRESQKGVEDATKRYAAAMSASAAAVSKHGASSREAKQAKDDEAAAALALERAHQGVAESRDRDKKAIKETTSQVDKHIAVIKAEKAVQKDIQKQLDEIVGGKRYVDQKGLDKLRSDLKDSQKKARDAKSALDAAASGAAKIGPAAAGSGPALATLRKRLQEVPKKTDVALNVKVHGMQDVFNAAASLRNTSRNYTATLTTKTQKNARGGIISGPGTGTSDSILSWVSNGEAVVPASSTSKNRRLLEWMIDNPNEQVGIPGFAKGKKPKSKKSAAERASDRWNKQQGKIGVDHAMTDAALAKAENTASIDDDIRQLSQQQREYSGEATKIRAFINSKSYKAMGRSDKASVQSALASAIRSAKSASEKIESLKRERDQAGADAADKNAQTAYDAEDLRREALGLESQSEEKKRNEINAIRARYGLAPLAAGGAGASNGGEDLAALLEQQRVRANNAAANLALSQQEIRAMSSAGDLGYGGSNALQAARGGGNTVIINSLSGYDPAIQQAIANTSNTGNSQGGNADIMYSGRVAV